jgi:hypothetical protein
MSFTDNLKKVLEEKKKITGSSITVYLRNLKKLAGKELENFDFLKDPAAVKLQLVGYKDTTIRNYLISIVSVLSCFPEYKDLHDKYYDMMISSKKVVETEQAKGELSETQEKNWISWEKVLEEFKALETKVLTFAKKKVISDEEYTEVLGYALLALYCLQEPRRNKDYTSMHVVDEYKPELDPEFNYLDLSKKKFIFNQYKTSKKYGRQDLKIVPELFTALKKYLKFRSSKLELDAYDNKPFLIRADGKPLDKSGDITKLLNKIFGKNIGSSLLRHILITDKLGGTHKHLEETAAKMAHSVTEQKKYILKPRGKISVVV